MITTDDNGNEYVYGPEHFDSGREPDLIERKRTVTETKLQTLDEIEATFTLPPADDSPRPTPIDDEAHQVQLYSITTHDIEQLRSKCNALTCDTKEGYEDTRRMIGLLRTTRTRIEKRRKVLNEEHQAAIKFVNGVAKKLTTFVESMETPLKEIKAAVDEKAEREKRAAAEAEAARIEAERQAVIDAERAKMKAEADRLAAEREALAAERRKMDELLAAERAKAAEERRIEQERMDKIRKEEQERMDRQREAAEASQRAAQERIDAENRRLEAERKAIDDAKREQERVEFEKQAKIKAEKEALEKVERDRIAAEAAAKAKAEAEEKERLRLESLRPDAERLRAFAKAIMLVSPPEVSSQKAKDAVAVAVRRLATTAADLEKVQL